MTDYNSIGNTNLNRQQILEKYIELGWQLIKIDRFEKGPKIEKWQTDAMLTTTKDDLYFFKGQCNVGVALGERSKIIDFDCDSPESQRIFDDLFGETVCPYFTSSRGDHKIFAWDERWEQIGRTKFGYEGMYREINDQNQTEENELAAIEGRQAATLQRHNLEVRIGDMSQSGLQTLLPPSYAWDNEGKNLTERKWVIAPWEVAPPLVEDVFFDELLDDSKKTKVRVKNLVACGEGDYAWHELFDGEVKTLDAEAFLNDLGIDYQPLGSGGFCFNYCPFPHRHPNRNKSSFFIVNEAGPFYRCQHTSCDSKEEALFCLHHKNLIEKHCKKKRVAATETTKEIRQLDSLMKEQDFGFDISDWEPKNSGEMPPEPIQLVEPIQNFGEFPLKEFKNLCPELYNMAAMLADHYQVPIEMPICAGLGIINTLMASFVTTQITEDTWYHTMLWYLIVADSGEGKTPLLKELKEPLDRFLIKFKNDNKDREFKSKTSYEVLQRELQAIETKISDAGQGNIEILQKLYLEKFEIDDKLNNFEHWFVPKLFVEDATPEACRGRAERNKGLIHVIDDEGTIFANLAGAYSGKANYNIFLKAHNGSPYLVDRTGDSKSGNLEINIPAVYSTMVTLVQPFIALTLCGKKEAKGSGFIYRLLPSFPDTLMGERDVKKGSKPLNPFIKQAWSNLLFSIGNKYFLKETKLNIKSFEKIDAYVEKNEPHLKEYGKYKNIAAFIGKLRSHLARQQATFHIASGNNNSFISEEAIDLSLMCMDYHLDQFLKLHKKELKSAGDKDKEYLSIAIVGIKDWIMEKSLKDLIWQDIKDRFNKAKGWDKEDVVGLLIKLKIIKERTPHRGRYDILPFNDWL